MKKILLGSTAIVAAAAAFAAPASAAENIKLGLGGYYQSAFVLIDEDVADTRTDSIKQEGEIYFLGETTLDNGVTVGVNVQLEAYTTASASGSISRKRSTSRSRGWDWSRSRVILAVLN